MNSRFLILVIICWSCTSNSSEIPNRPVEWIGEWKAEWETDPESNPGLVDMEFYMDGKFILTEDSITIVNNGYPGCIFAVDTLKHTQSWKVSGDSLILYNDPGILGMSYTVQTFSPNRIKLLILDDIFVTLTK